MKNRNTKDPGENHIYPFILSNFFVFIGIFFSLNSASEVAILMYSLAINLFIHWLVFYSFTKKKMVHFSKYYNNLMIGIFCISSAIPVFILMMSLLLEFPIQNWILITISLLLSFILKFGSYKYFTWESATEKLINQYRMSIEQEREQNFKIVKTHLESNPEKFKDYLVKSQVFDKKLEELFL